MDTATKTGVQSHIFERGAVFGVGVEGLLESLSLIALHFVVFIGPNRSRFHDQCLSIRIKLVGHRAGLPKRSSKQAVFAAGWNVFNGCRNPRGYLPLKRSTSRPLQLPAPEPSNANFAAIL